MRICLYGYTIGSMGSGARQYAADLGKWLVQQGHDVTLVTAKWGDRSASSDGLRYDFIVSHQSPSSRTVQIDFALRSLLYFRRHRKDFDLIHSLASYPGFVPLAAWVKRVTGLPVVHTLLAPCATHSSFDRLDGLICVSRGIREKILSPRATVIPPFVDLGRFRAARPDNHGRPDTIAIGTMGAPFLRKGIRQLVEAIPTVTEEFPEAHFFLAIDLPGIQFMEETKKERDAIGRFIAEHHLGGKVDIVGHVDVPRFLRSLDLFVYAVQTTLGMIDLPPTLIEALAAGCGVVTSRMGGIGELIEDHGNGLLVEDGDHGRPEAYAAKMLDLLRDRALLERVRRNGPPSVERFELGRVGRQVVEVYERVLRPGKAGEG